MAHNGVNNKRREETHWVIVYTLGTSGRGDASFQVAQSLSSGAARTVLFLTTFLWLSCSHALKTPQSPRGNLGNPAAFLSSGVPHSGPNTFFVSFVLPCHPQPIPHPQAFPERAHDTRPAWSLSQPVHRNVETPHRQTHAVCLCRPRCLVLVPSRPDTYTLSSVHPEEQESTCATVPVSIQA